MTIRHDQRPEVRNRLHDRRPWEEDHEDDWRLVARDRLQSGAILLAMAALAWSVTPLPAYIAGMLAIGGFLVVLAGLDELTSEDETLD